MSIHLDELLSSKKILLLQGPMGDFFAQFADWLKLQDLTVYKLNFNGGDWLYYHSRENIFHYRGRVTQFSVWLELFLQQYEIESLVCFGDCRKYHRIASRVAQKLNLKFFAFEEGYIRPNYITFEQDGVNFFSNFVTHLNQVSLPDCTHPIDSFENVNNNYSKMLCSALLYYTMWMCTFFLYPYYYHHRGMSPLKEFYCWLLSAYRRLKNRLGEDRKFYDFLNEYNQQYFVFALQVHNDSQIRIHSDLKRIESYIHEVMGCFAREANPEHHLVLKHHPMDRGYRNYTKLIQQYAKKFGIEGRVHYFCDVHLPTILKQSLGMVTINSTTGIQALFHNVPVKTLGRALYNLPRLTYQGTLSEFWKNPGKVDRLYFSHFRHELIVYSQLNGAYYGLSPWMSSYQKTVLSDSQQTKKPNKIISRV